MIKKEILSQIIVMLLSLLWVNALLSGSIGNLPDRRNLSGHKKRSWQSGLSGWTVNFSTTSLRNRSLLTLLQFITIIFCI